MTTNFDARLITKNDYAGFEAIYNDFQECATEEYKFELPPVDYKDFIDAVEKDLIKCIVLFEDTIPAAFLIYTTSISEAIELNIIHSYKMENIGERSRYLIKEFMRETQNVRRDKVVCYPMLGSQKGLIDEIAQFGFKFIGIVVLRFMMFGTSSRDIMKSVELPSLEDGYKLVEWNEEYYGYAVDIIREAFDNSADALFDPRFKSDKGVRDILTKVTENVYAEFLPKASTVLLYDDEPVGICFMNLTGGSIANIPLFGIKRAHQGKGLSKHLLHKSVSKLIKMADNGERPITEVNTTTETNNFKALNMYRNIGFKEDYNYPQSYLPIKK
ncbi:GNAT family N-acetyltransferase [bacterium]|nr:GNAT family N-acetyltransferase [bacterium]